MAQKLPTRQYFLACRRDQNAVDSIVDTAKYKGVSCQDVIDQLGLTLTEEQERLLQGAAHRAGITR